MSDLDDLFQNVLRTTMASEGLAYLRYAEWRSEVAFEAATAREYLQPGDDVLADMRDDCDLRRTVKREGNLIQLFACAKYNGVTAIVAGHDLESVEACIGEHRALFEPPASSAESEQPSVKFGFSYSSERGGEREEKKLNVPPGPR